MSEATTAPYGVPAIRRVHTFFSQFSAQPLALLNRRSLRAAPQPIVASRPVPPINQSYDTLRISMTRRADHDQPFLVRVLRRGVLSTSGPLQHHDRVSRAQLVDLQRSYERQLQMMRELSAAGLPVPPLDRRSLLALGRIVAAMLPCAVQQEIIAAVRRAVQRRRQLRLTLEVAPDAQELLCVPWELMALQGGWNMPNEGDEETFLLLNGHVTLTRQVQGVGRRDPQPLQYPLRIQAFAAAPRHAQAIGIDETFAAIAHTQPPGRACDGWYDGSDTLNELLARLHTTNPQIVHLLCHGERSDTGRGIRYSLLLASPDGNPQPVSAHSLTQVLMLARNLQLVVLQACHAGGASPARASGSACGDQGVESVALSLIRAGVPAVIAMQGEIAQQAASTFIRTCYTELANGASIEMAVTAGRIVMSVLGDAADWSLPVLYQGSDRLAQADWRVQLGRQIRRLIRQP